MKPSARNRSANVGAVAVEDRAREPPSRCRIIVGVEPAHAAEVEERDRAVRRDEVVARGADRRCRSRAGRAARSTARKMIWPARSRAAFGAPVRRTPGSAGCGTSVGRQHAAGRALGDHRGTRCAGHAGEQRAEQRAGCRPRARSRTPRAGARAARRRAQRRRAASRPTTAARSRATILRSRAIASSIAGVLDLHGDRRAAEHARGGPGRSTPPRTALVDRRRTRPRAELGAQHLGRSPATPSRVELRLELRRARRCAPGGSAPGM